MLCPGIPAEKPGGGGTGNERNMLYRSVHYPDRRRSGKTKQTQDQTAGLVFVLCPRPPVFRPWVAGEPPDPALAKWLADLPPKLQRALADIGVLDRAKVAAGCPLVEHLDGTTDLPGFHQSLVAKGATTLYTTVLIARVRRILAGCEFRSWPDINPSLVMAYLDGRRAGPDGIGPQTFNSYLVAFKLFCSWMVHDGRAKSLCKNNSAFYRGMADNLG